MKAKYVTQPNAAEQCRALGYVGDDVVCALLDIKDPTLRNRRSRGTAPPSYKVGNRHVTKLAELEAWIRRHRVSKRGGE